MPLYFYAQFLCGRIRITQNFALKAHISLLSLLKKNSSVEQGFKVISNVIVEVAPTRKFVIYYFKKFQCENFAGINFEVFTSFG